MVIKNTILALLLGVVVASPYSSPDTSFNGSDDGGATLFPRVALSPLDEPTAQTSEAAVTFMEAQIKKVTSKTDIGIVPNQKQLDTWTLAASSTSSGG